MPEGQRLLLLPPPPPLLLLLLLLQFLLLLLLLLVPLVVRTAYVHMYNTALDTRSYRERWDGGRYYGCVGGQRESVNRQNYVKIDERWER